MIEKAKQIQGECFMTDRADDVLDVLEVVHRYFACLDKKDWKGHGAVYADRVVTDFVVLNDHAGFNSVAGATTTTEEIVAKTRETIGNIKVTQHMITNTTVIVSGDEAQVSFCEQALHYHPSLGDDWASNTWIMYGRVDQTYRRTPAGWKLHFARLIPVYDIGNKKLLELAAARD